MRKMIVTLMTTVSVVTFGSIAMAADAVQSVPEAPAANDVAMPRSKNWSGAYVGGAIDYNFGRFTGTGNFDNRSFGGALYGGYNFQNGNFVFGPEADIGYSGNDGSVGTTKFKQGVNGSVRGRLGYDLSPFMVYGTAGVAAHNLTANDGSGAGDKSGAAFGLTGGVGVETMVTDTITARAEYRYTGYQSQTFNFATPVNGSYDEHSIKLGLGVKF